VKTLGDLMVSRGGSINPRAFPDEEFELYSIPAHDRGGPEIALGSEIGSSKQIVQQGDVMISKIIPPIRRARVVDDTSSRRQIASGEWIVFHGQNLDGNYLRHFLISDDFHGQFMNTVAGVGGSLVRARPEQVKAILVPLPTLDEQRRIAAILDHADALRAKRRQVLAHLDTLTQAIFNDMFGSDLLRGDRTELGSLASLITKGTTPTSVGLRFTDRGVPFLRAQNLQQGTVRFTSEDLFIDEVAHRTLKRSVIRPRDLLMSIAGTIGRVAIVPEHRPEMNCNQAVAIVRLSDPSLGTWLMCWLNSLDARGQIAASSVTATIANLSLGQIGRLKVPVATVDSMRLLAERVAAVRVKADIVTRSSAKFDDAFQSLQSRAFRGEL